MKRQQLQRMLLILFVCLGLGCGSIIEPVISDDAISPKTDHSDLFSDLRGVYLESSPDDKQGARVARLAVRLITPDGERKVRLDYPFKSQNKFRFEVSSNRDGWLYVLHKSPKGEPQLLWPKETADNHIKANRSYLIPSIPAKFVFDREVGEELFYVVIKSQQQAPDLVTIENLVKQTELPLTMTETPSKPKTKVAQIGVRSSVDALDNYYRSIIYDPGTQDGDPNIYFTAHPKNINDMTIFEFKLQHGM